MRHLSALLVALALTGVAARAEDCNAPRATWNWCAL